MYAFRKHRDLQQSTLDDYQEGARKQFIADFSNWEIKNDSAWLNADSAVEMARKMANGNGGTSVVSKRPVKAGSERASAFSRPAKYSHENRKICWQLWQASKMIENCSPLSPRLEGDVVEEEVDVCGTKMALWL